MRPWSLWGTLRTGREPIRELHRRAASAAEEIYQRTRRQYGGHFPPTRVDVRCRSSEVEKPGATAVQSIRKAEQLRAGEAQRGAGVFEMDLRLFEIVEGVSESGRYGHAVTVDREAPEAAQVGKVDDVSGSGVRGLLGIERFRGGNPAEQVQLEVAGAQECPARRKPVEVSREQVPRLARSAIQLVHDPSTLPTSTSARLPR